MANEKWFTKSYRRSLLDMHIEDWDHRFMSQYDPVRHVDLLKTAQVQSAMLYANSCVGLCYCRPSRDICIRASMAGISWMK